MKRIIKKVFIVVALITVISMQGYAQVETPDVLTSSDATWSQVPVPSADYGLSTDLNGESSIKYKLVDASDPGSYSHVSTQHYYYDIVMELVHSDGDIVPIEYYHYDSYRGWSKKSHWYDSWGQPNGSTTHSNSSRGFIEGSVRFTYGQNGDKVRGTITNTSHHAFEQSYFTVFEVRTIRYDLYDDRELLGNANNQNNLSDHTTPISVYVHRNLSSSTWSTLSLPFDIPYGSLEKVFGEGSVVAKFDNVNLHNHIINFYTAPVKSEGIKAGQAYLIKAGKDFSTNNPFFVTNVTISRNVQPSETADTQGYGYSFCGLLQPAVIKDKVSSSQLPVYISGNHLYQDTGTTPMKGFRAYFKFPSVYPDGTSAAPAKNMIFSIDDNMTTAVDNVTVHKSAGKGEVYNLQGQRIASSTHNLPKGIYIIDGKKVLVK